MNAAHIEALRVATWELQSTNLAARTISRYRGAETVEVTSLTTREVRVVLVVGGRYHSSGGPKQKPVVGKAVDYICLDETAFEVTDER